MFRHFVREKSIFLSFALSVIVCDGMKVMEGRESRVGCEGLHLVFDTVIGGGVEGGGVQRGGEGSGAGGHGSRKTACAAAGESRSIDGARGHDPGETACAAASESGKIDGAGGHDSGETACADTGKGGGSAESEGEVASADDIEIVCGLKIRSASDPDISPVGIQQETAIRVALIFALDVPNIRSQIVIEPYASTTYKHTASKDVEGRSSSAAGANVHGIAGYIDLIGRCSEHNLIVRGNRGAVAEGGGVAVGKLGCGLIVGIGLIGSGESPDESIVGTVIIEASRIGPYGGIEVAGSEIEEGEGAEGRVVGVRGDGGGQGPDAEIGVVHEGIDDPTRVAVVPDKPGEVLCGVGIQTVTGDGGAIQIQSAVDSDSVNNTGVGKSDLEGSRDTWIADGKLVWYGVRTDFNAGTGRGFAPNDDFEIALTKYNVSDGIERIRLLIPRFSKVTTGDDIGATRGIKGTHDDPLVVVQGTEGTGRKTRAKPIGCDRCQNTGNVVVHVNGVGDPATKHSTAIIADTNRHVLVVGAGAGLHDQCGRKDGSGRDSIG